MTPESTEPRAAARDERVLAILRVATIGIGLTHEQRVVQTYDALAAAGVLATIAPTEPGRVVIDLNDAREIAGMIRYTMTSYKRDGVRARLNDAIAAAERGTSEPYAGAMEFSEPVLYEFIKRGDPHGLFQFVARAVGDHQQRERADTGGA